MSRSRRASHDIDLMRPATLPIFDPMKVKTRPVALRQPRRGRTTRRPAPHAAAIGRAYASCRASVSRSAATIEAPTKRAKPGSPCHVQRSSPKQRLRKEIQASMPARKFRSRRYIGHAARLVGPPEQPQRRADDGGAAGAAALEAGGAADLQTALLGEHDGPRARFGLRPNLCGAPIAPTWRRYRPGRRCVRLRSV